MDDGSAGGQRVPGSFTFDSSQVFGGSFASFLATISNEAFDRSVITPRNI